MYVPIRIFSWLREWPGKHTYIKEEFTRGVNFLFDHFVKPAFFVILTFAVLMFVGGIESIVDLLLP